jgi:hypothetical protein
VEYRSISEYLLDIQKMIDGFSINGQNEISKRLSGCLKYINGSNDNWMMFYRNLLAIKDEYERKLSYDEINKIIVLIEAAKKVVDKM